MTTATELENAPSTDTDDDEGGGLRLNVSLDEKVVIARDTAIRMFELLGAGQPRIDVAVEDEQIVVHLGEINPQLQPQGDTRVLEALQFILNKAVNKMALQRTRLSLDAEGFRRRRPEGIDKVAEALAQKALLLGKAIALGPLSQMDLRILSHQVGKVAGVQAQVHGSHDARRLVVAPQGVRSEEVDEEGEGEEGEGGASAGKRRRRRRR
jgi:predicted RNA-binding protein Jag